MSSCINLNNSSNELIQQNILGKCSEKTNTGITAAWFQAGKTEPHQII